MDPLNSVSDSLFAYYITSSKNGTPIPAIFVRDANNPDVAKLLVINEHKKVSSTEQSIKVAQDDLTAAIEMIRPIATLSKNIKAFVTAALYKRGYAWAGPEKIEITIPAELSIRKVV